MRKNAYSHEDRAEQLENAKNAAREECCRWKTLQSDYTDYVACLELNGQGVLRECQCFCQCLRNCVVTISILLRETFEAFPTKATFTMRCGGSMLDAGRKRTISWNLLWSILKSCCYVSVSLFESVGQSS